MRAYIRQAYGCINVDICDNRDNLLHRKRFATLEDVIEFCIKHNCFKAEVE